jgi:hypothetical protein
MAENNLNKDVGRLGFSLMETSEDFDANRTLAEVVKSKDSRLWEGFPVMLANAANDHEFRYDQVVNYLDKSEHKKHFHDLVLLALAMYRYFHLSFSWSNQLRKRLPSNDVEQLKDFQNSLNHSGRVSLGEKEFNASRLLQTFKNYFEKDVEKSRRLKERHEELSLEYALSQMFPPKQKELFKKKLDGEVMTKVEKEYYSRKVKKKVAALANPELHRLAQRLMEY